MRASLLARAGSALDVPFTAVTFTVEDFGHAGKSTHAQTGPAAHVMRIRRVFPLVLEQHVLFSL